MISNGKSKFEFLLQALNWFIFYFNLSYSIPISSISIFFAHNRSLLYGLSLYLWMYWKSLTSTLIYSWYIFQEWCFISIQPLILFCITSWVQNFEKDLEKFFTALNGHWHPKGFVRHHPVMTGDAKQPTLHQRTQVKRLGRYLCALDILFLSNHDIHKSPCGHTSQIRGLRSIKSSMDVT